MSLHVPPDKKDCKPKLYHVRAEKNLDDIPLISPLIDLIIECRYLSPSGKQKLSLFRNVKCLTLKLDELPDLEFFSNLRSMPALSFLCVEDANDLTEDIVKRIASLDHLTELRFERCNFTDEAIKNLAPMQQLRSLSISSSLVTDLGLEYLTSLNNLETLELYDCKITDVGISRLTALKNLKELVISPSSYSPNLDNLTLKYIASLTWLKKLRLEKCDGITEEGLEYLSGLIHLEELQLGWFYADLKSLENLINLQNLSLICAPPQSTQYLSKLLKLKTLRFGSSIVEEDIQNLLSLKQLESLDLSHCKISDQSLQYLSSLEQLQYLDLSFTDITDVGCSHLMKLKKLQFLNLEGCSQITSLGVGYLSELPELRSLNLSECINICDRGLLSLANCKHLEELKVYKCDSITDRGIASFSGLKHLRHINAIQCRNLSEQSQIALPDVYVEITVWRKNINPSLPKNL